MVSDMWSELLGVQSEDARDGQKKNDRIDDIIRKVYYD